MFVKKLILSGVLALGSVALLPMSASAHTAMSIDVRIAPPVPRVEVVPAPRAGYLWSPGYWQWHSHQHVWIAGHWLRERRGYHWVPEHWEAKGAAWRFHRGYWAR